MADVIYQLNVGAVGDLVKGAVLVDYTQNSLSGNLFVTLGGVQVPLAGLTLTTLPNNAGYTITGSTGVGGTDVVLTYGVPNPTAVAVAATTLGTTTNVNENVLAAAPCYASGTLIRTARGDVAVEELAVGDLVMTASGAYRPMRWLGHRRTDCRAYPDPRMAWPVRIAAHAFGTDRPSRDLLVSPGHSICVDILGEVLIPASALLNGTTVTQVEVDEVTYWHVELDSHDIILAEGLPAESYLDMGNREFFVEADAVSLLATPDVQATSHADFCRPYVADGPLVQIVRDRMRTIALSLGWTLKHAMFGGLHVVVDDKVVEPVVDGLAARFALPADAQDVWLVSGTNVPAQLIDSADGRRLGIDIRKLAIDDGLSTRRDIAMDDPRLCIGFHAPEDAGTRRWTAGRARLPASLWEGCRDSFFLRIEIGGAALPQWVEPAGVAAGRDRTSRRLLVAV